MLPSPRPGTSRDNLLKTLNERHTALVTLRGGVAGQGAQAWILKYLEWVNDTVRDLSYQVSAADVSRLVLTPGYDRLLNVSTMNSTDIGTQRVLNGMVSLEIDHRVEAFDAAIKALKDVIARWRGGGVFVAPDTGFYIEHPAKLEEADFRPVLKIRDQPVHVLVPIAVIDELDNLKRSKDPHVRWRAGYTLAVLDRVCSPGGAGLLRPANNNPAPGTGELPSGNVTLEIIFDPPGHVRLPITDDELVARILEMEPLAERHITLVTYDTGQSTRGELAGLRVSKQSKPLEPEPGPQASGGSRNTGRRQPGDTSTTKNASPVSGQESLSASDSTTSA